MIRLNRIAEERGWRQAILEVYRTSSGMMRYVLDPSRSRFLDILPLSKDKTVLEVGSGLGQITTALAVRAGMVEAIEVVSGQAIFTHRRCQQEGLENVRVVCGGDDSRLPYSSAQFDVAILNLVLEWCFRREATVSPAESQERLLRETARVLKPGGLLYLCTKNRYSIRLLLGGRDEHVGGLRFGSALPRWMVGLISRIRGTAGLSGYIHSYQGVDQMLRRCGFEERRSYWAAPEMRYPAWFIPARASDIARARRHPGFMACDGKRSRWLMERVPAPLVKNLTPGLIFLARKRCPVGMGIRG
ncbi:MAG: class I SAM-dependent methyltransferase [Planctomycetes bacterium]|nr:class I SAM-dependent methyltransferase [Planctomycetota bacterium]